MLTRNRAKWIVAQDEDNNLGDDDDSDYSDAEPQLSAYDEDSSDVNFSAEENTDDSEENDNDKKNKTKNKQLKRNTSKNLFLGKDGVTKWSTELPTQTKCTKKNIIKETFGVKSSGKDAQTPLTAWELFFDSEVLENIVTYTNKKLQVLQEKYQRSRDCVLTSVEELRALFGLLYMIGSLKLSHTNTRKLWALDGTTPEFFRAAMSVSRFSLLLRALRFDDVETRKTRSQSDKLAPIREVLTNMNEKFEKFYCVGESVTIDEMMFAFKGRCSFRQYLPMKPHSYGLKTFAMVDSDSFYTSHIEIYTGKQPPGPFFIDNRPSEVVKRVASSILGTGRNITMDNWFSSIPLIDELQEKHQTTIVSTIKKNKKELPQEFVNPKQRPIYSSLIGYNNGKILTSYIPKKNKCVLVVSSLHQSAVIDKETGTKQKPETITYYNHTKGGVDTVDQLRGNFTVARCSCRWPLTVFFAILDITGINAQIIYTSNSDLPLTRGDYLMTLAKNLTRPWMLKRAIIPNISSNLRDTIKRIAQVGKEELKIVTSSRKVCAYCPKRKNRKTTVTCSYCANHICGEHTRAICEQCFGIDFSVED